MININYVPTNLWNSTLNSWRQTGLLADNSLVNLIINLIVSSDLVLDTISVV